MSTSALPTTLKQPLTADEQRIYGAIFRQLDVESLGVVTGETARTTFEKSGLPPVTLGEIWQLADPSNLGFLTQFAFCVALRLIGHVQAGAKPDSSLIDTAGPLAVFQGVAPSSTGSAAVTSAHTGGAALQQITPQFTSLPPLTNNDISKFSQLFAKNAPNGIIDGTQARNIFLKAKLPTNVLGQIWTLADRTNAGQLTREEFVVAMFLIQGSINGSIKQLPQFIPESVWDQVKAFQAPAITSGSTATFSPQPTGVRPAVSRVPSSFNNASSDWVISSQKKAQFDSIFEGLDKQSTGVLGPDAVASFLMTSKLPQDVLATVWDLADIHNTGEFTKDEFAIAMFLVQKKIAGAELPDVVPDSLLPHSHPAIQQQFTQPVASPVQSQPTLSQPSGRPQIPSRDTKPQSSINDLLDLNDTFTTPSPVPGSRNVSNSTVSYTPTGSALPKPFAPSSSFGQTLVDQKKVESPVPTPASISSTTPSSVPASFSASEPQVKPVIPQSKDTQSFTQTPQSLPPIQAPVSTDSRGMSGLASGGIAAAAAAVGSAALGGAAFATRGFATKNDDLLADSNPEVSGKLSQATTDMANLSNQIGSLTNQTSQLHEKRNRAEKELAKITALKQDIEVKLSKLRAAYDQEVKQTEQVESLLTSSRNETEQLRKEASVAEAQYNQLQSQLQTLQAELDDSQKENASLKERLSVLNSEQAQINSELERVRTEVKQSKGIAAINSEQLSVAELKSSAIREEIEKLLSSTRELDAHHENYTKKHAELEVTKRNIEDLENALLLRKQQYEQAQSDFALKEQELQAKVQEQQQSEQAIQQHDQRIAQLFANLQERQRQHDAAEQQLEQQQVEYAQRIQQFTEKQIQDVTTGFGAAQSGAEYAPSSEREVSADEPGTTGTLSKGTLAAAAVAAVTGASGATGVTAAVDSSTKSESEKDTGFDSPVAATTDQTASVGSDQDDQFPSAQQFNHLDIERPESVTSSVQNNAPQSVRGDDIEETPNIDAITEEPALAEDVLSKDYNSRGTEGDSSGVGSFEIVHGPKSDGETIDDDTATAAADSTVTKSADDIEQSLPGAWSGPVEALTSAPVIGDADAVAEAPAAIVDDQSDQFDDLVPAANESPVPSESITSPSAGDDEFPPIQELDIVESDSDDDEFHETLDAFPRSPAKGTSSVTGTPDAISASPLVNAASALGQSSSAVPAPVAKDAFGDDFDGLEEAHESSFHDNDDDLDSQNFSGDLDSTTFFGADELQHSQANFPQSTQPHQENEEWEQIFAGFGNQPQQQTQLNQPQAVPVVHSNSAVASRSVPPRIATTPRSLAVQELTGMGFSEEEALKALEKEKWNLESATNFLLDNT